MKQQHLFYLFIGLYIGFINGVTTIYAQEETMSFHGLEPENDRFQDAFFNGLRYKAIGNYNLALKALDEAENEAGLEQDKLQVVSFERAQNHYHLKEYQESIAYLEDLLKVNKQREVLVWLYQVYMEAGDINGAKEIIVDLLGYSEVYLPSFYMLYVGLTHQPEEALKILNSVFITKTNTRQVGFYRDLIQESLVEVKDNSKEKTIDLSDKETLKLQTYLQNKEWEKAEMYMELLLQDANYVPSVWEALETIDDRDEMSSRLAMLFKKKALPDSSKRNLLSILLDNTNNSDLLKTLFPDVYRYLDAQSLKNIGDYFIKQANKTQASQMYLMSLAISFDNYSLIVETLQLLSDTKEYEEQLELAETAMEYYPFQPMLYLYKGEALVGMQLWEQAKRVLEEGVDYIIDYPRLEQEFRERLQNVNKHLN